MALSGTMKIKGHQAGLCGLTYELKSLCLSFPINSYYSLIPKGCRDWPLLFEHPWGAELLRSQLSAPHQAQHH